MADEKALVNGIRANAVLGNCDRCYCGTGEEAVLVQLPGQLKEVSVNIPGNETSSLRDLLQGQYAWL